VHGEELLGYIEARKKIYLTCYKWVLENKLKKLVTAIRIISKNKPVVLLDYNTNPDVNNPKKALSHASLIKAYIEGNYPE
jgi:sugar/nucleoside kinase (ribokinase family)